LDFPIHWVCSVRRAPKPYKSSLRARLEPRFGGVFYLCVDTVFFLWFNNVKS
jgi:hypothetical protein